jgi:hypothetical protein
MSILKPYYSVYKTSSTTLYLFYLPPLKTTYRNRNIYSSNKGLIINKL